MDKLKNKIKIAFFLPTLEVGGAELTTLNLLNGLNKEDFNLSLVLGKKIGYFVKNLPEGISIVNLKTLNSFLLLLKIRRYLLTEQLDIFVSTFPRFNVINIFAKIFSGTKTKMIIVEHNPFSSVSSTAKSLSHRLMARFPFPYLMKFLYPRAEAIVCVSHGIADDILEIVRAVKKIKVIYNPIIDEKIYVLAKETVKHPWFSDLKIPIILAVGSLVRAKDYPTLIAAFSIVCQEKPVHLVILGEGRERKKLEKITEKFGISENVVFLGFQENPYKYMDKASIFVLSSIQEGFPTVLIEAMACGLPAISTDCKSGPNEIIASGKNGILVPPGDKKALAGAIIKLLTDPFLRQKFSKEGGKKSKEFIIENSTKEYEKLFFELSNSNN